MNLEQRASIRKKISLNILINYDLTYTQRWKVLDLSLNGVLLEMNCEDLAPGMPIEAVIAFQEHEKFDLYRLPAEVVRLGSDGVALRFNNYDNQAYTALVNLLYSA